MEQSVAHEPERLVHHLDLARVYVARGIKDKARAQYQAVIDGNATEYNDRHYKEEASKELAGMQ